MPFDRPMVCAGTWYPATAEACRAAVAAFAEALPAADVSRAAAPAARYGVVPHAGWTYSGAIAAAVFRALTPPAEAPPVQLVVALGGHLPPEAPLVAMAGGTWATPVGPFALHEGLVPELQRHFPDTRYETRHRYQKDHSIEVQLPLARLAFPQAALLPIRVPPNGRALELGRLLADYVARTGLRTVAVASTDLTHYGPAFDFEPAGRGADALAWVREQNDPAFGEAVADGNAQRILTTARERHNACSPGTVAALRAWLGPDAAFTPLHYATSADVTGEAAPANFVGYLGGVFAA